MLHRTTVSFSAAGLLAMTVVVVNVIPQPAVDSLSLLGGLMNPGLSLADGSEPRPCLCDEGGGGAAPWSPTGGTENGSAVGDGSNYGGDDNTRHD